MPVIVFIALVAAVFSSRRLYFAKMPAVNTKRQQKNDTRTRSAAIAEDVDSVLSDIEARLTHNPGELEDVDDSPQMIFMDFAGQRMYYLMHHVFISAELSVYIVVFSLVNHLFRFLTHHLVLITAIGCTPGRLIMVLLMLLRHRRNDRLENVPRQLHFVAVLATLSFLAAAIIFLAVAAPLK